jgi:hypothetical protein
MAMTRDCFEPVAASFVCCDGLVAATVDGALVGDCFFADFDIEILRSVMAASRRTTEAPPRPSWGRRGRISRAPPGARNDDNYRSNRVRLPVLCDDGRKSIERHLIAAAAVSETRSTRLRACLVRVLPAPPRSPAFAEISQTDDKCRQLAGFLFDARSLRQRARRNIGIKSGRTNGGVPQDGLLVGRTELPTTAALTRLRTSRHLLLC